MIRKHDNIMQNISCNHKSTEKLSTLRDHGMAEPLCSTGMAELPCSPVRPDYLREHGMAKPPCSPVRLYCLS